MVESPDAPTPSSPLIALAAVPLFAGYDEAALAELAAAVRTRRFRRGEVIFHRGDPGTTLFIVVSGCVKIAVPTEGGDEALLTVMRPGDFFGELSLLDGAPRSATAIALEPVELWTLHRDDLLRPMLAVPGAATLLTALARRLRRTDALVEEIGYLDLDARLARALLRLAEEHGVPDEEGVRIDLPLTQTDLAAMIGATRPRVNLLLGAYQDAGLMRLAGRALILRDVPAFRIRAGLVA
jgi:CRP/FNR family transcriptional regulator/CRP/FNR family cyclic AMP-dependent transcriptional regulator